MKEINKSEFLYPKLIRTPYFGDVPYQWISGGSKQLILIDNMTDFYMKHLRLSADEIVKDVDDIDWEINIDEDRFKANFVEVSFDDFSKYYK